MYPIYVSSKLCKFISISFHSGFTAPLSSGFVIQIDISFLFLNQQYNPKNVPFLWFGSTFDLKQSALPRKYCSENIRTSTLLSMEFSVGFKLTKVIRSCSFSGTSVAGRNAKIIEERGERVLFSASLGFQLNWQVQTQLESESKYFCRWLGGLGYKPQLSQSSQAGESSDRGFSSLNQFFLF